MRPSQDQVVVVHSLAVQAELTGVDRASLTYYLDGADQGSGDTSMTIPELSPGRHRLEVEAFDARGQPFSPRLRAGVDFTVQ